VKAILFPADENVPAKLVEVDPDKIGAEQEGSLQSYLDDWAEFVRLPVWFNDGNLVRIVVAETGLLRGLPYNARASIFYAGPQLVGDALMVGWDDNKTMLDQSELVDVPQVWLDRIAEAEGRPWDQETSDQKI
jgi:hypothetical protein